MAHVLLVEDELSIAQSLVYALETEHFQVKHVSTGGEGVAYLEESAANGNAVQLAILDVGLPDMSGFDVCQKIQASHQVAVMFLTARDSEIDKVLGLELGGDDYVTKPFSPREVVARVRAILRRHGLNGKIAQDRSSETPKVAGMVHDEQGMTFELNGKSLALTAHEYHLLLVMYKHPGRVYSREQLLDAAWDDPGAVMDRVVDAHIKSLRSKLREVTPNREWIETRRGLGYVFVAEESN